MFTFGSGSGDTETQYIDKNRIDAHFARLKADKVNVLRLWMFSHESWHGFETAKGVYNEQQFALFDYIIQSAKTHGVKLLPVFENYWETYGGIDRRLEWEGLSGGQPARGTFFNKTACPSCFTSYKNYVSYALNRTNHYSGIKYKDDPTIFAWELMNEPRYENQTPNENTTGITLRKWVDEMGAFIKGIDPNHMLGTGLEAHETRFGFGGDEGNPFVYIHQSPSIDFTSAHPYPTEHWADLSIAETQALVRTWVHESHDVISKPFYLGEFNVHNVDRAQWWNAIFQAFEQEGGDGTGFWWYQDREIDGKFGVIAGAPELAAFRAHSDRQAAKNGPGPTPTPTVTPTPTPTPTPSGCTVTYRLSDWGSSFNAEVTIKNTTTAAINGWKLTFSFPGNQTINNSWNATTTQSGKQVTATHESWTATIPPGGTIGFGLNGASTTGTNGIPAQFTLNNTTCTKA
ncbi:cellulose binding domain-containing protein [Streptosporangium canum]|uniref:cellulose binding domain-containing protein n=1 Tax=Streptosporangium canum TaxID=324952 RepID=UPI0037BB978E